MRGIDCEPYREGAWPERVSDIFKKDPFFADAEKWADFDRSLRGKSPTPVKPRISPPRDCEIAFDADGKGNRNYVLIQPLLVITISYFSTRYMNPIEIYYRLHSSTFSFVIIIIN